MNFCLDHQKHPSGVICLPDDGASNSYDDDTLKIAGYGRFSGASDAISPSPLIVSYRKVLPILYFVIIMRHVLHLMQYMPHDIIDTDIGQQFTHLFMNELMNKTKYNSVQSCTTVFFRTISYIYLIPKICFRHMWIFNRILCARTSSQKQVRTYQQIFIASSMPICHQEQHRKSFAGITIYCLKANETKQGTKSQLQPGDCMTII